MTGMFKKAVQNEDFWKRLLFQMVNREGLTDEHLKSLADQTIVSLKNQYKCSNGYPRNEVGTVASMFKRYDEHDDYKQKTLNQVVEYIRAAEVIASYMEKYKFKEAG